MAALGRLRVHHDFQDQLRKRATARWHDNDLVFAFRVGTTLYAGNVSRSFRPFLLLRAPAWQTGRHTSYGTASSLMQDAGIPIEKIARLIGHRGTATRTPSIVSRSVR
jgi:hypothetical protein